MSSTLATKIRQERNDSSKEAAGKLQVSASAH